MRQQGYIYATKGRGLKKSAKILDESCRGLGCMSLSPSNHDHDHDLSP